MRLFPESTLAQMRAINEDNLPHSCQVYRNTSGYGPGGVVTEGWAAHGAPIPCRAAPMNTTAAAERIAGDQVEALTRYIVAFRHSADVTAEDRLVVTGVNPDGGAWELRLEVVTPPGPRVDEVLRKAVCEVRQFDPATM